MLYEINDAALQNLVVNQTASFQDVINALEANGRGFVVVVSDAQNLVGVITDGDLRRAMLKYRQDEVSAMTMCQQNPLTVQDSNADNLSLLCERHEVTFLPMLSGQKLTHLFLQNKEIVHSGSTSVFILAGGEGKRLMPYTKNCPKPLVKVNGDPILSHILRKFRFEGFRSIYLSVNYLSEQIEATFKDGFEFGLDIKYIKEDEPLGTAGSLSLLTDKSFENLIVSNGDVLTDLSYRQLLDHHKQHKNQITIAAKHYEMHNPYGVLIVEDGEVKEVNEKPTYKSIINTGIYVISQDVLSYLDFNSHCDMTTLIQRCLDTNQRVGVYYTDEYWMDLGTPNDLQMADERLSNV